MSEIWSLNGVPWTSEPWLPYQATKFIEEIKPEIVFEWGMGGSTLFFLRQKVKILVSVEHIPDWYKVIRQKIEETQWPATQHWMYLFPPSAGEIGPDKSEPLHYKSGSTELGAVNFLEYASAIDNCDPFDLILIDGMARPACIVHAFPKVKPGGWLVIDNTGDRPYYLEKTAHLFGNWESGWERFDFFGYGPILDYKWQTTFFHNVKKADYE